MLFDLAEVFLTGRFVLLRDLPDRLLLDDFFPPDLVRLVRGGLLPELRRFVVAAVGICFDYFLSFRASSRNTFVCLNTVEYKTSRRVRWSRCYR